MASSVGPSHSINVSLLDDTEYTVILQSKPKGDEIIKDVNAHLNLEEPAFFGLMFEGDDGVNYWLDPKKPINKQIKDPNSTKFKFRVMYYTPDPNTLSEYTRYLFTLQIRRDLLDGKLICTPDTGALLASYIVQGELGNYDPTSHPDGYLKGFHFVPNQTPEIESKIVDYHRSHCGKGPAESDRQMLDIACKLGTYGLTQHHALDADGNEVGLAVFHMGVLVYQNSQRKHTYFWANLRKLSFKKKRILLKLRSESDKNANHVIKYAMNNRNAAKNFWKVCINHHVFFRAQTAEQFKKRTLLRSGSKYAYNGKTQREIEEAQKSLKSSTSGGELEQSEMNPPDLSSVGTSQQSFSPVQPNCVTSFQSDNTFQSDETGSYSIHNERSSRFHLQENFVVEDLAEDNYIRTSSLTQLTNKDALEQTSEKNKKEISNGVYACIGVVHNNPAYNSSKEPHADTGLSNKTSLSKSEMKQAEKIVNCEFSDVTVDTEPDLSTGSTPFSVEVASMFPDASMFMYHISPVTESDQEHNSGKGDEESDNMELNDGSGQRFSEYTEVDANQVIENHRKCSDRTEADEEAEQMLKQKVKELYASQPRTVQTTYDSDSDATAVTVDEEESAFEETTSLPTSSASSVSSIHQRSESYLKSPNISSFGDVYSIAKEILLTERTLVKDLEVLTVSFRNIIEKEHMANDEIIKLLYDNIDPLYDYHCSLLAELEECLAQWERSSATEDSQETAPSIGGLLHCNMRQMKVNVQYMKRHEEIFLVFESLAGTSSPVNKICKQFELGNLCYLSLNTFILKPIQRLFYYRIMLEKLVKDYGTDHSDGIDAKVAFEEVSAACKEVEPYRDNLVNLHKLVELRQDLVYLEKVVHPKRKFIREGCLHKICRKGPQPRMFILLSDILLYTSQGMTATHQFRARASIPLRAMKVEDGGVELHSLYAFTIISHCGRSFIVAASSPEEKNKWMKDIQCAIDATIQENFCDICEANKTEFILNIGADISFMCPSCKGKVLNLEGMRIEDRLEYWKRKYPPLVSIKQSSNDGDSDDEGSFNVNEHFSTLDKHHAHGRIISSARKVCWHRNVSISMKEYALSLENSFSGYLRRRYKNTNRWQKMWVVFTNFCMYFFKGYENDSPFASLPLIGYTITKPLDLEVNDDFAIKMQFKSHTYIFKADHEYIYKRWMEVLTIATENTSRQARLKSRINCRPGSST